MSETRVEMIVCEKKSLVEAIFCGPDLTPGAMKFLEMWDVPLELYSVD